MAKRRDVAVWLDDQMARHILGAPPRQKPSRWVTKGVIVEEAGFGLWLETNTLEELRLEEFPDRVEWTFKSSQLLIPWGAILTIQAFEGPPKEMDIGFRPTPAA